MVYKRRISKLLLFIMIVGSLLSNGTQAMAAGINSKYLKVNSTLMEFTEVIYVDSVNGDDINGDGSKESPFAGMVKAFDYMKDNCKENGAIVISDGQYDVAGLFTSANQNINSKYNGLKVSLFAETLGGVTFLNSKEWHLTQDNKNYRIKLKFYGIIISSSYTHGHLGGDNWINEYYNCVFNNYYGGFNMIVSSTEIYVQNCAFVGKKNDCYTKHPVKGTALNCVSDTASMDPYKGTKKSALYNATFDSNYNITSAGWENAGEGINPDGTKAHIGVYGGQFAWGSKVFEVSAWPIKLDAAAGNTVVDLSWDKVDNAVSYNIMRSTTSGGPYETNEFMPDVTSVSGSSIVYTDSGLTNGTTYYYVVSAISSNGDSIDSNEAYATPTEPSIINKLKVVLETGEQLQLSINEDLNENTKVMWSSSDTSVAEIDTNGIVTALSPGNTVINVSNEDGSYSESLNILVVDDATDYRLAVDLRIGKSCRLTVDDNTNSAEVIWTAVDPSIAIIDSKGIVTAISEGLTLMIATDMENNFIGQVYVRVRG